MFIFHVWRGDEEEEKRRMCKVKKKEVVLNYTGTMARQSEMNCEMKLMNEKSAMSKKSLNECMVICKSVMRDFFVNKLLMMMMVTRGVRGGGDRVVWRAYTRVIYCVFDQIPNLQNCFITQTKT